MLYADTYMQSLATLRPDLPLSLHGTLGLRFLRGKAFLGFLFEPPRFTLSRHPESTYLIRTDYCQAFLPPAREYDSCQPASLSRAAAISALLPEAHTATSVVFSAALFRDARMGEAGSPMTVKSLPSGTVMDPVERGGRRKGVRASQRVGGCAVLSGIRQISREQLFRA